MIPLVWKTKLLLFFYNYMPLKDFPFKAPDIQKNRIFIFLAADYGNLGDVAITYAQHKFLNKYFPDYIVTEIPISTTLKGITFVKKIIKPNDVITTVGGGNMGDLYDSIELYRRLVISNFHSNKIISFPQTIDFRDNTRGIKAFRPSSVPETEQSMSCSKFLICQFAFHQQPFWGTRNT